MTLDPEIHAYYNRRPEEHRHQSGPSQLEALRTRSLIERFAPVSPAIVVDVGGASGAYAFWMSDRGYAVHLLDPVERLINEAQRLNHAAHAPLASIRIGDARDLPYESASAEVVLLLGPMYHLTDSADRARALQEAHRVLKPGGVVFAAAISRWASALDALGRDLFASDDRWALVEAALPEGQHRNPTERVGGFTTAYFHRPDEFRDELLAAEFEDAGVFGLECVAGIFPDFDTRWSDPRQRADIVRIAELFESEPALLGVSPHLLGIGRKPHAR